jgi:hypothetical protein
MRRVPTPLSFSSYDNWPEGVTVDAPCGTGPYGIAAPPDLGRDRRCHRLGAAHAVARRTACLERQPRRVLDHREVFRARFWEIVEDFVGSCGMPWAEENRSRTDECWSMRPIQLTVVRQNLTTPNRSRRQSTIDKLPAGRVASAGSPPGLVGGQPSRGHTETTGYADARRLNRCRCAGQHRIKCVRGYDMRAPLHV